MEGERVDFLLQTNVTEDRDGFLIFGPEKDVTDRIPCHLCPQAKISNRLLVKFVNNKPVAVLRVD